MHLARVVPDAARMTPANVSGPGVPHAQGRRYRSAVRFQLLGPLVVSGDDGPIAIGGPKQRLVLAHLLLRANTTVPTDRLADAVWGEEPPETARATLQTYVSRLRGLLGSERIYGQPRGYRFSAVPEELDTLRFETLLKEAHEDGFGPKAALDVLNEALELWRGPALADLADEPSLSGEIARLEELRLQATEEKIETELDLGRHGDAVVELETLTRAHPLRERLWGELMLALYRAGRQADALSAFDQTRSILSEELGIDPSNELQHLHERILRHDPDLDLTGEPLRGYRLLEQIGEGAFGVVYRAIQPQVHRDVAVKAIHPHLANDPEFIRRFEAEAQFIARLEHPHVVPLYDYWREPGGAYLVMRFLRGGNLAEALDDGAFDLERAARMLDQVGGALASAHRQGVVHRDVKPSNILLDEEGNAYLADFGIAKDIAVSDRTEPPAVKGSLLYLAPEQIRGETITPRTDVYALGVVLYEVLVGEHPFADVPDMAIFERQLRDPLPPARRLRRNLPPSVDDVIATATAKDPGLRFKDALSFAVTFRNALPPSSIKVAAAASPLEVRNPYKGLRSFTEADADDFYGRGAFVERLLKRWSRSGVHGRFLAVVGPSGSGKSSAVRAGLVPALRRGVIEGSETWFVTDLVPGRHPMEELEAALIRVAADPPGGLLQVLESGPRGLHRAVDRVVPEGAELVLFVDQFEEVFTLTDDEATRSLLLESLRVAVADPASRVRIVVTLRADFYDRPLLYPRFGELMGVGTEVVTPLAPDELEQAIVRPASSVGLIVEPSLVAQVASDVAEQPGALPMVQYALTELFDRRQEGRLTLEAYRDIGGVGGALAASAEHLFATRQLGDRDAVRELFLRLVTLGEGTPDTRRRVRLSELASIEADLRAMESALDAYGRHRLLTFDRDSGTREPTVEVAHETLFIAWERLRGWIDEARDDIRVRSSLASAAADWETAGRDESFLLRGARLEQIASWADTTTVAPSVGDAAYMRASVERRDDDRAAEAARQARERALERRSIRRLRGIVAAVTAAALVASVLTAVAVDQRSQARREARLATARELAAAALANLTVDPERSILLALQAVVTTRPDGMVLQEANEALHSALAADRLLFAIRDPSTANVAWSPDGRLLATGGTVLGTRQPDVILWDAATGGMIHRLSGHTGDVDSIAFSPDGSRLVTTAANDPRTIIWNTRTGRPRLTVPIAEGYPGGASFSPDGRLVAIGDTGDVAGIRIVDARTGDPVRTIGEGEVDYFSPSFSPDGTTIGARSARDVVVYDVATGQQVLNIPGAAGDKGVVIYSPDGSRIATSCCEGSPTIWDARTGRKLLTLEGPTGAQAFSGVAWSADGALVATGGIDGSARVWDARSGRQLISLVGHAGAVAMVAFSPDGNRLLTGGGDGAARVWDVTPSGGSEWMGAAVPFPLWGVAYSNDGSTILTTGLGGGGRMWHSSTGERVGSYPLALTGAFGPGSTIVTGGFSEAGPSVRVLRIDSGEEVRSFPVPWLGPGFAMSPDRSVLATSVHFGGVALWEVASGTRLRTLHVSPGYADQIATGVAFSPDGTLVAGLAADALFVWEIASGRIVLDFPAHSGLAFSVTFSPDGSKIATSGRDGAAVWDASSGDRLASLSGVGGIAAVRFSPDGRLLATAGDDGKVRIWGVAAGRETLSLGSAGAALGEVAFSPDGTKLASVGLDGILRVYVLPIDELVQLARDRVTRGFTERECSQYLHLAACTAALARPPGPSVDSG